MADGGFNAWILAPLAPRGEGRANGGAVDGGDGEGIVDGLRDFGEVTGAHLGGGNGEGVVLAVALAGAFKAGEPEGLVAAIVQFREIHGAIELEAVLIEEVAVLRRAVALTGGVHGDVAEGVETDEVMNRLRGFGFLTRGEGTPDIFVHMETLRRYGLTELRPGA